MDSPELAEMENHGLTADTSSLSLDPSENKYKIQDTRYKIV